MNERTEAFQREHHDVSLSEVVALTAAARGETLRPLSEHSDTQIDERLDGAPWGDGAIGASLAPTPATRASIGMGDRRRPSRHRQLKPLGPIEVTDVVD
ncbi:MAG: hypothetical protein ACYDB2_08170 [Acidimicrobiales bacterium]